MPNQSFDSNGDTSASNSDSGAPPVPIAKQLSQQSYLSNIQHQMEALMKASGVEAEDQTSGSAVPISAGGSPAGSFSAATIAAVA